MNIINQKSILKLLLVGCVLISVSFTKPANHKLILLDVGHGGKDTGTSYQDILEKDIVREIATQIIELNSSTSITIKLVNEEDEFISIEDRVEKINTIAPDLLISIHVNAAYDSIQNGVEAFVTPYNDSYFDQSLHLAYNLTQKLNMFANNGVKETNFPILQKVNCPAVVLETGFLSNNKDRNTLLSIEWKQLIAYNILQALYEL